MRRVLFVVAAAAALLTPLIADAQGRGHGYGRDQGGGRWRGGESRAERRYDPRPDYRRRNDPRNGPPPYAAGPPGRSWRQGDYLPPMYRGDVVRDRQRYRLRTPPPGYDWVGVGPDIYLMQRGTGLILDTIPGGY